MPERTPHRIVDEVLDGLVEGGRSVGETIARALDKPPEAVDGPRGIHRVGDEFLDGVLSALETEGEGIADALDEPVEIFGVPPKGPEAPELPEAPEPPRFRR